MQIFISCERQDRGFANRLAHDLRSAGAEAYVSNMPLFVSIFGAVNSSARARLAQSRVDSRTSYHWLVCVLSPHSLDGFSYVEYEVECSLRSPSASVVLIGALPYHENYLPAAWTDLTRFDATRDYQAALAKLVWHLGLTPPQTPRSSVGQVAAAAPVSRVHSAGAGTSGTLTVFVSYSHQDDNFVRRLIGDLHTQGIGVWIDHERLTPGTADWDREIRRGISAAKGVIYVASEDAAASPYVGDELAVARDNHVVVYPLWARGSKWSSCAPLGWGRTQYIDARESKYEAAVRALVASILGSVGR